MFNSNIFSDCQRRLQEKETRTRPSDEAAGPTTLENLFEVL